MSLKGFLFASLVSMVGTYSMAKDVDQTKGADQTKDVNQTKDLPQVTQVEVFSCTEKSPNWEDREIVVYADMQDSHAGSILVRSKQEKSGPFQNLLLVHAKISLSEKNQYLVDHSQLHISVDLSEILQPMIYSALLDKKEKLDCRLVTAVLPKKVEISINSNEVK